MILNDSASIFSYFLKDNGIFPNSVYPVLFYKNVLDIPIFRPALAIKTLFQKNNWYNFWKDGIYEYDHYHSNTHEVLGIYKGSTTILIGGEGGRKLDIEKGDVLIFPAGTAHKNLLMESKIKCIGAYPNGIKYDMKYGKPEERPEADENIKKVSISIKDPVFGQTNGIPKFWSLY